MSEKIVRLKPPIWFAPMIREISGLPSAQPMQEHCFAVFRKLNRATEDAEIALRRFLCARAELHAQCRLWPAELQWSHEHYDADLDRIVINKSFAKHIWISRLRADGEPQFELITQFRPLEVVIDGKTFRLSHRQWDYYKLESEPLNFAQLANPSPIALTRTTHYRVLRMGMNVIFDDLSRASLIAMHRFVPQIENLLDSGKAQEIVP